jgi:hypothetical protein
MEQGGVRRGGEVANSPSGRGSTSDGGVTRGGAALCPGLGVAPAWECDAFRMWGWNSGGWWW